MIHPIEGRYGRAEVKAVFEEENKLQRMLDVEAALSRAHAAVGNIPKKDADIISRKAKTRHVKVARVRAIEREINHDVMAVVKALSEQCGESGKHVHLGATSNDITDTALALQLKDYIACLEDALKGVRKELARQARKNIDLVCVGRTHAQHAVPTTYGLKFAIYALEVQRHVERLREAKRRILVGQMTGAVGTQAAFGKHAVRIQRHVMKDLGLRTVEVSNQVIQRDRHAEFMLLLALIAETLNKVATEIRNLQRTEIDEVREGFGKKQVGSSTMPHKMNPIHAERIGGIARVIKADAMAALENIPLWHERDLTNSSCERIIIPEACILTDYMLQLTIDLVKNLAFNKANIKRNLEMTQGRIMAESVMIKLSEKGYGRQRAHAVVRDCALESYRKNIHFKGTLMKNRTVTKYLSEDEIDRALDPERYVGTSKQQVKAALKKLR
ncbi:MAG: adenylosuccinate lyase [Candidatus Altiarchaeales archaeon]|nr:adenylosuccinate lyase [Candidatus Altiarchaeales archaeon]MBD3416490.1 adenylosuccinate lyase [Candidatus Altiarchaeales archaeon]